MKTLSILILALVGVCASAQSELLRGSVYTKQRNDLKGGGEVGTVRKLRDAQRRRRLQSRSRSGGEKCTTNKDCNNNGKCKGVQLTPVLKQGKCHCDDEYTGKDCDTEIIYEFTILALSPSNQQRGSLRCADDMASFVENYNGSYDKLVQPVEVDWCGGRFHQPRFRMAGDRQLKSSSTEVREIVVAVVLSRGDVRSSSCLAELESAALDLDDMKWKDQDKLWRTTTIVDEGPCDGHAVVLAIEDTKSRKSRKSRQLQ